MPRMGEKLIKVNEGTETAIQGYKPRPLGLKEEKFCVQFVLTDDRHLSYERAGYLAKNKNVQSAAITRLLRQPKIQARIEELTDEMLLAQGVTKERITGKLAKIAFREGGNEANQIKCLELIGKDIGMFKDNVNFTDTAKMAELDERERAEALLIAKIRLSGADMPLLEAVDVQGQGQAEGSREAGNAAMAAAEGITSQQGITGITGQNGNALCDTQAGSESTAY